MQAFFWSFLSTCMFWTIHRRMFARYSHSDGALTAINLILLGEITLIPVTTRILTERPISNESLELYIGLFAVIGLTNTASWIYAAFLSTIADAAAGLASKIVIAVMNAVLPVVTTTCGVLSTRPETRWTPLLIPVVVLAARLIRLTARHYDERHSPAVA